MVVAYTNDFGVGVARLIFNIRIYLTNRSIHLHAVLNRELARKQADGTWLWVIDKFSVE